MQCYFSHRAATCPLLKKKDDATKTDQKKSVQKKVTDIEEAKEPKPGDIKVIDGIEYIYARNRKYLTLRR